MTIKLINDTQDPIASLAIPTGSLAPGESLLASATVAEYIMRACEHTGVEPVFRIEVDPSDRTATYDLTSAGVAALI